jgi:NDP-sugar pyrophosphorylase family protein
MTSEKYVMNYEIDELRVIIPVGGIAKRLLPLTSEVSKACIRLLNRPLIEIGLLCLAKQGVKNFIFGVKGYTNYRSLHDYFESGIGFSARYGITPRIHIKYQPNEDDRGSADSAKINMEYYDVENPVFAVQGDNIFDINLQDFLRFHEQKGAMMTIGLRQVENVNGYGIADVNKDMRISRFVEKPTRNEAPSNLANTGLYLVTPEIRSVFQEEGVQELIQKNRRLDFGYDFIPYLIKTGRPVYGYTIKGSWYDIGTPKRYLEAMTDILHGKLSSLTDFGGRISKDRSIWVQGESKESILRREEIIQKVESNKIHLEDPVLIGRHCQVNDGVKIVNSCIDNYSKIGKNAVIENSAVMDRVIIGENVEIRDSIIGRHSTIESTKDEPTRITSTSVIADDVTIAAGSTFTSAKVYPHLHISKGNYREMVFSS